MLFASGPHLGFGLVPRNIPVVNLPRGCSVARIRSRSEEFIRVYLRTPEGFEEWFADFDDADHRTLRLTHMIGQNIRPSHVTHRPSPIASRL